MVSQSPILAFKHTENQTFQSHLILTSILVSRTDNSRSEYPIMFSNHCQSLSFKRRTKKICEKPFTVCKLKSLQVILFGTNCAFFYINLHELFGQFISWTNWVNSGKFMDNSWISCQVKADKKKVYDDHIIINLYVKQLSKNNRNFQKVRMFSILLFNKKKEFSLQKKQADRRAYFVELGYHATQVRKQLIWLFELLWPPMDKRLGCSKGQLILEWLLDAFIWTKKRTEILMYFCPSL